jgi:hypothetical protein
MARRPFALLVLLAILALVALPAASFAQSAGDDQYQDPLGPGDGGPKTTPSTPPAPPTGPSRSATQTPTPSAGAAQTPSSARGSGSNANVPLAHTGFEALVPGIAGVLLLAGGIALLRGPRREARKL